MKLESVILLQNDIEIPFEIKDNILNTREILREVVRLYQKEKINQILQMPLKRQ